MTTTQQYSDKEYIPPAGWGQDHWSTLAYVESVMTDCAGFQLGQDARMRSNRRHARVMASVPKPKRSRKLVTTPVVMAPDHGTRLSNGQILANHDDWCCSQDMAAVGFFNRGPSALEPGNTLHLSPAGQLAAQALRAHKQSGGNDAEFSFDKVPGILPEMLQPPLEESFTWTTVTFDITAILAEIASGRLKPHREDFDADFITGYAESVLALRRQEPDRKTFSFIMAVDGPRANEMPESVLEQPLILAYVGKKKGVLDIDGTGPHYVLIDGNHRIAKAYFCSAAKVPVYVLNQAQVRPFKH